MSTNESGIEAARGASALVLDAVEQVTHIVESVHATIAARTAPLGAASVARANGVAGFVYGVVRRVAGGVRGALDAGLSFAAAHATPAMPQPHWDVVRGIANGVLGDHLERSGNPLAIPMRFRQHGHPLVLDRGALRAAIPDATGKIVVFVHGLCMSDRHWLRNGHDHGRELSRDAGWTPLSLQYNTGRHISDNGRDLAALLERLAEEWPASIDEIAIVGHSMGGLVARSAAAAGSLAAHRWRRKLTKLVFLSTPHHGAPLERAGNSLQTFVGVSPYTRPLARLGMLRSAGITDLRWGNVLEEHWSDRCRFEPCDDVRTPLPLPTDVACFAIAVTTGRRVGDVRDRLFGDGLVPVASALGRHAAEGRSLVFAEDRQWIGVGRNHWDVLDDPEVYERLKSWLG